MREPLKVRLKKNAKSYRIQCICGIVIGHIAFLSTTLASKPGVDRTVGVYMNIFWCVFDVWALGYVILKSRFHVQLKRYNLSDEKAEREYQAAEEVYKEMVYIGKEYLMAFVWPGFHIYKMQDIVWIYIKKVRVSRHTYSPALYIYTKDKKHTFFTMNKTEADDAPGRTLLYIMEHFPHVVIGYTQEKKRLFKDDFYGFLQLQYYKGILEEKEQEGL